MTFDDIFIPDFWPFLVPLVMLQLILMVLALFKCIRKDRQEFEYMNRAVWVLIILCLGMIGPILYLILERD